MYIYLLVLCLLNVAPLFSMDSAPSESRDPASSYLHNVVAHRGFSSRPIRFNQLVQSMIYGPDRLAVLLPKACVTNVQWKILQQVTDEQEVDSRNCNNYIGNGLLAAGIFWGAVMIGTGVAVKDSGLSGFGFGLSYTSFLVLFCKLTYRCAPQVTHEWEVMANILKSYTLADESVQSQSDSSHGAAGDNNV